MSEMGYLNQNLDILSVKNPYLATKLLDTKPGICLAVDKSRQGSMVPVIRRKGHLYPMHSRFDPISEGNRIAGTAGEGFLIALGLGGGYHLKPLLKMKTLSALLIVDQDLSLARGLLENFDFTWLFSDSRVNLMVDCSPQALLDFVLDSYIPILYGNLGTISLAPRVNLDPAWFLARANALQAVPEILEREFTVQSRFGQRWFINTLSNLSRSEEVNTELPPTASLLVTAAGPSLQSQMGEIKKRHMDGMKLLATDTSLPHLILNGISPDIVLSIDCQFFSYQHFLRGLSENSILVLDIASPPLLGRLTNKVVFFSSKHPFSLYLNRYYRTLPTLDSAGGNVTHAAISLAKKTGARQVALFGADFSYPGGEPYAKGTYIYPLFQSRSRRTSGSEDYFWKFIEGNNPIREEANGTWRYRISSLDHYRETLKNSYLSLTYNLFSTGNAASRFTEDTARQTPGFMASPLKRKWQAFMRDYCKTLKSLPPLNVSIQDYLAALEDKSRQAWASLLPVAATFKRGDSSGFEAVERARIWTMEKIRLFPK